MSEIEMEVTENITPELNDDKSSEIFKENVDLTGNTITSIDAASAPVSDQGEGQAPLSPAPCFGSLDLVIRDPHGDPIPNLNFKVLVKKQTVFSGKSNATGRIKTIENLELGSVFEIQVKNDIGNYKMVAIGKIECEENYACLSSPKTRFEFSTYSHTGESGNASNHKKNVISSHNQQHSTRPTISGSPEIRPTTKDTRNEAGHPVAAIIDGAANWYNIHNDKAAHPVQDALTKLNMLVTFMEHQATLDYRVLAPITSDEIIVKMRKKTFVEPVSKSPKDITHWCAKYVKVGLWYAGYGPATQSIGSGVIPARLMGPELLKAGFKEATLPKVKIHAGQQVIEQPDITFALPGDVIIYKKTAAPDEAGHIDVRTYHGFVSDFVWPARNGYPDVRKYAVIGVYRKHSDTMSAARVKAFLRIIREHEAKGFADPYKALKWEHNQHVSFSDMSTHPSNRVENRPAGAYQIKWRTFTQAKDETGWSDYFTPIDQDRAAIYLLQSKSSGASYPRRTALGYIMEGKPEQAVNETKLWNLFAFLPNGGKQQQITMDKLKQTFDTYTKEYAK